MKFLNNIDLQKNEIQNFRVQNLATAPANPVVGQHYFNTVDKTEYVFNGTIWIDALSQGNYTFKNGITEADREVSLDAATKTTIGGVIVGDNIDVANGKISVKDATDAQKGLIQLATDAEATAGTDEAKAINAKQVKTAIDAATADKIALTDLSATGPITYDNATGKIGAEIDAAVTADSTKLISSGAVDTAIKAVNVEVAKKANITDVNTALDGKVDKVTGKSLVADTDIAQITTNKEAIAALQTEVDKKLEEADLPTKLSDLTDDSTTTPIEKAKTLDGLTATVAELNFVDGVTSNIQTQLDAKLAKGDYDTDKAALDAAIAAAKKAGDDAQATADAAVVANEAITAGTHTKITYDAKGLVTGGADLVEADIPNLPLTKINDVTATAAEVNKLAGLETTAAELAFVHGVTSNIQDQLDGKLAAADVPQNISDLTDDTDTTPIKRAVADKDGNAIDTTYIKEAQKGVANGVATLDAAGLVPASQLPSYVDDVIELKAVAATAPAQCVEGDIYYNTADNKLYTATGENTWGTTGVAPETGKIYVNIEDNMSYRYSGTALVQIGADKLLGFNGQIVGDDTTTTFTIEHNLGTRNVVFEIYEAAAPYEKVWVQVLHTSANALQVVFSQAPATGTDYNITVIAIG